MRDNSNRINTSIVSYLSDLASLLPYYKNPILRVISFLLLLSSVALIFFPNLTGWWKIIFLTLLCTLLIKEYYQRLELENKDSEISELKQGKDKEIQKVTDSLKKDILHTVMEFLGKFFQWKGGFRFTIFTLSQQDGVECIRCTHRIDYGSPAGIPSSHLAYFTKGGGLPGKAWADAWDKERLEDLIDKIKIGNIPEKFLTDREKLKKYYKTTFDMTDEIYDSLGDSKYEIKSYLAVGVVGLRNELSYVLSIDSTESGAFDEFQTAKDATKKNLTEITRIQGQAIASRKEVNEQKADPLVQTETPGKEKNILAKLKIPEEILRAMPQEGRQLFEELTEGDEIPCSAMMFEVMKQRGIVRPPFDIFVYSLAMSLKMIEIIIQKRYPLN